MSNTVTFHQSHQRMELLPRHILDTQCVELLPARTLMQCGVGSNIPLIGGVLSNIEETTECVV
jgi:hypothetical protein